MSQSAVESVLGRLLTDFEFRELFFRDAVKACGESLTPRERAAVQRLDMAALRALAVSLDRTIVRASVGHVGGSNARELFAAEQKSRVSRLRIGRL